MMCECCNTEVYHAKSPLSDDGVHHLSDLILNKSRRLDGPSSEGLRCVPGVHDADDQLTTPVLDGEDSDQPPQHNIIDGHSLSASTTSVDIGQPLQHSAIDGQILPASTAAHDSQRSSAECLETSDNVITADDRHVQPASRHDINDILQSPTACWEMSEQTGYKDDFTDVTDNHHTQSYTHSRSVSCASYDITTSDNG